MHERLAVVSLVHRRRQLHPTMNSAEIATANNGEYFRHSSLQKLDQFVTQKISSVKNL